MANTSSPVGPVADRPVRSQSVVDESGPFDRSSDAGSTSPSRARYWVVGWAVLAGVAVALHLAGLYKTSGPNADGIPNQDKIMHFLGFAAPVLLIQLTVRRPAVSRFAAAVVGIFVGHAVVSELIQHFFYQSRTGDPRDVVADVVGVSVGWLAYLIVDRRRPVGSGRR